MLATVIQNIVLLLLFLDRKKERIQFTGCVLDVTFLNKS